MQTRKWTMRLRSLLIAVFLYMKQAGAENKTCKHFEEVPEEEYDRTYSSIHEAGKRPLGFVRETVVYNNDDLNPCYQLQNVGDRQVEIMYETDPPSMLCFTNLAGIENCYDHRHQECKYSSSNTPTIKFFCDVAQGCSESAVNFWLRITVGPSPVDDSEGAWCMNRDGEYPEDLAPIPPDFNPITTTPASSKGSNLNILGCDLLIAYSVLYYLLFSLT